MRLSLCSQMWRDLSNPGGRRGKHCLLTNNSRRDLQTLAHFLLREPQDYYPPLPMFTVPMDFQNHIFSDASREGMGGHFGPLEWRAPTPLDLADQFDRGTITIAHLELYAANLTLHLYLEYLRGCYPRRSCSPHVINAWCDNQVCVFALRPYKMASTNTLLNDLIKTSLRLQKWGNVRVFCRDPISLLLRVIDTPQRL